MVEQPKNPNTSGEVKDKKEGKVVNSFAIIPVVRSGEGEHCNG